MKKTIRLLSFSFLALAGAYAAFSYDRVAMATQSAESLAAAEQETVDNLEERIGDIADTEEQEWALRILDYITGVEGDGIPNPNDRNDRYEALGWALVMPDDAQRLAALKNMAQKLGYTEDQTPLPDEDDDTGTEYDDEDTGTEPDEDTSAAQAQKNCMSRGGSWSYGQKSCKLPQTTSTTNPNPTPPRPATGQGSGGGSSGGGSGSGGGGQQSGGGGDMGGGGDNMGSSNSGSENGSEGASTESDSGGSSEVPKSSGDLAGDGSGKRCGPSGAKVTAYGYRGDKTPDSNSNYICKGGRCTKTCKVGQPCGMGNRSNLLRPDESFAISDDIKNACGLKVGDVLCVDIKGETICGIYEDRSPQTNNVDRYLPNVSAKTGNSYFKRAIGQVLKTGRHQKPIPHPGK